MAVALDYDGLGRPDFMIVTEDGGLTLVNRGFGAFLVNAFLHRQFHATPEEPLKWTPPYPFRLSPARAVAPGADREGQAPPAEPPGSDRGRPPLRVGQPAGIATRPVDPAPGLLIWPPA